MYARLETIDEAISRTINRIQTLETYKDRRWLMERENAVLEKLEQVKEQVSNECV